MTQPTADPSAPTSPRAARRAALGTVAALMALAAVSTAGASGSVRVADGDTLSGLALRHGTTVAALRLANGLSGDLIVAGQRLRLPGGGSAATGPAAAGAREHVVRPGETVSAVAARYGSSVRAVLSANGLSASSLLQPGQRLAVPAAAAASAPAVGGERAEARRLVAETARRYGVDPSLALAVAHQESGFQQDVVSGVGAVGVMQVLPRTGRALSAEAGRELDLQDTADNVTAGVLLLRQLARSEGSDRAVLAGYYQGLGSLARQGVLPQTEQYLRSIDALRPRFANG